MIQKQIIEVRQSNSVIEYKAYIYQVQFIEYEISKGESREGHKSEIYPS